MRIIGFLLGLLALSGCAVFGNLHELKSLAPSADDFSSALASEYLAYADSESEQGHHITSNYFAGKGLKSLHGETVAPEEVGALSERDREALTASREQLLSLLTDDNKHVAAQKAARAQLLFDCWVTQASRKLLPEETVPCADEFAYAISELQDVSAFFIQGARAVYTIEFAAKSAKIPDSAQGIFSDIAAQVANIKYISIALESRGPKLLARKRLNAVKAQLVREGVSAKVIHIKPLGASKAVLLGNDRKYPSKNAVIIKVTAPNIQAGE